MRGQGEKDLSIGKSDVGDHHQIHLRGRQPVGDRHGFMWTEYPLGDNRLGIDLPGFDQTFEVLADRPLGLVLGVGIEHADRINHQPELWGWPLR